MGGEDALDQRMQPIAHHGGHRRDGKMRQFALVQQPVHRGGNVRHGINQCAVEIENHQRCVSVGGHLVWGILTERTNIITDL